jgi:hypothetical protein
MFLKLSPCFGIGKVEILLKGAKKMQKILVCHENSFPICPQFRAYQINVNYEEKNNQKPGWLG